MRTVRVVAGVLTLLITAIAVTVLVATVSAGMFGSIRPAAWPCS